MIPLPAAITLGTLVVAAAATEVPRDPIWTFDRPALMITAAHGLSSEQGILARRSAATYAYVGMCRGAGLANVSGAVQMITAADPTVPLEAAALEILGVYTRAAFGRQDSWVCERAFEDATRSD